MLAACVWLVARWGARIDELARSTRAALGLATKCSVAQDIFECHQLYCDAVSNLQATASAVDLHLTA